MADVGLQDLRTCALGIAKVLWKEDRDGKGYETMLKYALETN